MNDKCIVNGERVRFTSELLPPYMRRSPKVDEVLPVLYLRGLSTGDFEPALKSLLGDKASGLSATTISRLTAEWKSEYEAFRNREIRDEFVYVWVDGVHFNIRLEDDRLCTLVVLGGVARTGRSACWRSRTLPRKQGELAVRASFAEEAREEGADVGDRRRGAWFVGGRARALARDDAAVVLGAQAQERSRQAATPSAGTSEGGASRDYECRDLRASRGGVRDVSRRLRSEVSEGGRLAHRQPEAVAGLLRLPGRALGAHPLGQSNRVGLRDASTAPASDERCPLESEGPMDGLQAVGYGEPAMETRQRTRARRSGVARREVRRWFTRNEGRGERRLIDSRSTTLDNNSQRASVTPTIEDL